MLDDLKDDFKQAIRLGLKYFNAIELKRILAENEKGTLLTILSTNGVWEILL